MSDGGFNHNLWAQQNLGSSSGGQQEFKVNEEESPQLAVSAAPKAIHAVGAKIGGAIPFAGPFLQWLFPSNPGEVSIFAGLETEGFGSKPINVKGASMLDASGGAVYQAIAAPLIKNGSIPGGNPYGEGGDAGGGGSFDSGGSAAAADSHHFDSGFSGLDSGPIIAAGGGNRFEVAHMSESSLGDLHPLLTPTLGGRGMGAGMEMG